MPRHLPERLTLRALFQHVRQRVRYVSYSPFAKALAERGRIITPMGECLTILSETAPAVVDIAVAQIPLDEEGQEDLSTWRVPPTVKDREITNAIRQSGEKGLVVKRADGQVLQLAATARVIMGQLMFVNREAGKIVVNGRGGVDLDSVGRLVMERIALVIREYMLTNMVRPQAVMRQCYWLRKVLKGCYITYAQQILTAAPIDIPTSMPSDSEVYFENIWFRDVVPINSEMKKAIAKAKVPAGKARETMLLKYVVETGIDEFLELLLNQLTSMYLFPLPKMRAMRSLRAYSQYFLLYKATDLDIATALTRLIANVKDCERVNDSAPLAVCVSSGVPPFPRAEGQPDPKHPQPALWCPPGTMPPPPAYGTRVALTHWYASFASLANLTRSCILEVTASSLQVFYHGRRGLCWQAFGAQRRPSRRRDRVHCTRRRALQHRPPA